jgi:hypothetical protein
MSSYFYAFEDAATCGQEIPSVWTVGAEGEPSLTVGALLRSQRGVWLTQPVFSEPDPDTGEQTVVTPGVRSADFVILSPVEYPDAADYLINPDGEQGFM